MGGAMPTIEWSNLKWWLWGLLFIFILAFVFVWLIAPTGYLANHASAASFFKVCSLFLIIITSASIAFDEKDRCLQILNIIIWMAILIVFFIGVHEALEISVVRTDGRSNEVVNSLNWMIHNGHWLTITPLLLFAILDLYQMTHRKYRERRERTMIYLLFADLVCVAPMLFVLGISIILGSRGLESANDDAKLFNSGAMAFLIFAHAIAQKLCDIVTDQMETAAESNKVLENKANTDTSSPGGVDESGAAVPGGAAGGGGLNSTQEQGAGRERE